MRRLRIARHRLQSMLRPGRLDRDLQREIDLHLDQLTREYVADGLTEREARARANLDFGSIDATKEQCRDMRRISWLEHLVKDLGYTLRLLRKSPGFTATAILSMAIGIGANTAIFSLVNALLLRPMPFDRPDRLVAISERDLNGTGAEVSPAPGTFVEWRQSATTFQEMSAYSTQPMTLSSDAPGFEPQRLVASMCSANCFATLGVTPLLGRPFAADEDRTGAPRVVAIGYDLWMRQFGGSRDLVGRSIRLNEQNYEVVAVMPRSFAFPGRAVDLWVPIGPTVPEPIWRRHDLHFLQVVGRMRDGVTLERAAADVDRVSAAYKTAHPNESAGRGAAVVPLRDSIVSDVRTPLVVLLAAVACVLLIVCVNLANLMLTRAVARAREIGIRIALGAGRGRVVRQLLTESVVLGVAGGGLAVALAVWAAQLLTTRVARADALLPSGVVPIDARVAGFALGLTLLTALGVGLVPAVRLTRGDVTSELKDGTRSATAGRSHGRFRAVMVAAEVALSLMLLVAAGLLVHSLSRLYDVRTGVRVDHTLAVNMSLPAVRYPDPAKRSALFTALGDRLQTLPGVISAALTSCTPLTGPCNILFFYIEGRPYVPGSFFTAHERSVDPRYFIAAGIPLLKGRTFTKENGVGFDAQHPKVGKVIVSQALAKTFFASEDPIGQRIFFDMEVQRERNQGIPAPRYEIVGVVGDVVPSLDRPVTPTLYRPLLDGAAGGATILVHTAVEPASVAASVRHVVAGLDRGLVASQPRTLEELIGRSTADRRFTMALFVAFAALAVLLATIGLYGVVSYAVSQRTTEIGVRMALGATAADVSRLIVMQGFKPAAAGVALGLAGAAFAVRLLRTLLFGVAPLDPLTFAVVPPALLIVALLACYMPARRAVRLDPTVALRQT